MKERLFDRIKRKARERYDKVLKWIIRKAIQKHDDLSYGGFMAYSWGRDEVTDYHVTAERSYKDVHIYGTRVERLIDGEWVQDK
jgi:nucleoside-specific outer membrane channel protein Tsx